MVLFVSIAIVPTSVAGLTSNPLAFAISLLLNLVVVMVLLEARAAKHARAILQSAESSGGK